MLRLLAKLALFLLPLAILSAWLEVRLRAMPNSYTTKRQMLEREAPRAETVVFGSSNALYGVNPDVIDDRTINFANVSESVAYDTYLARRALDQLPRLNLVVLCPPTIAMQSRIEESPESWRAFYYYHFMDVPLPEGTSATDARRFSLLALYTPRRAARFALEGFRDEPTDPVSARGWAQRAAPPDADALTDAVGVRRARFHQHKMRQAYFDQNVAELDGLFKELVARKVHGALVVTPVYHTYSDHMDQAALLQTVEAFTRLAERYGVVYRDYLTDPRFEAEDFSDSDHLNAHGAEKFSRILAADVVRPVARP